jgi:hypothetical protein
MYSHTNIEISLDIVSQLKHLTKTVKIQALNTPLKLFKTNSYK